jgi:hypothetical protein
MGHSPYDIGINYSKGEYIFLLCETYSLANSTLETCALETIFMIGPFLAD